MNDSQPEFAKPTIRTVLVNLLRFQRDRADLEKRIGARVQVLAKTIETDIESIWRQMAQIQAFNRSGVRAEPDSPRIRFGDSLSPPCASDLLSVSPHSRRAG